MATLEELTELAKQSQKRIDYQYIVVYDKSTVIYAQSLFNQAAGQQVKSAIWTEEVYNDNRHRLTNYNHIVFLTQKLINENFANPNIESKEVIPGVLYKHEGNSIGLYLDPTANYVKMANIVGNINNENWADWNSWNMLNLLNINYSNDDKFAIFVKWGYISLHLLREWLTWKEEKKAKRYLTFRGVDKFSESLLKGFVSDNL